MNWNIYGFFAALTVFFFSPENTVAQIVQTDKPDYVPGNTAIIAGNGFSPGESIKLQVLRIDTDENSGPEHDPWIVHADANGNVQADWCVTDDELGTTLQLTATGLSSGLTARKIFTDAAQVNVTVATGGYAISADFTCRS